MSEGIQIFNLLRQVTATRALFIDAIGVPQSVLKAFHGFIFHLLLLCCTLMIMIAVFGQTKKLTLFSLHPTCMTVGTVICVAEGIVAYRNTGIVDSLAPIMEAPKKNKSKSFHRAIQYIGVFFLTMGMVAILGNKFKNSKSFVPSTIHSTVAVFTIIAILAQVYVGIEKMSSIQKIRRWHGNAGLLTWDLLVLTSLLGLVQFLHFNIFNTCACMALLLVWFAVHIQFREEVSTIKSAESDADNGLLIADADEHNV